MEEICYGCSFIGVLLATGGNLARLYGIESSSRYATT